MVDLCLIDDSTTGRSAEIELVHHGTLYHVREEHDLVVVAMGIECPAKQWNQLKQLLNSYEWDKKNVMEHLLKAASYVLRACTSGAPSFAVGVVYRGGPLSFWAASGDAAVGDGA